MKIVEVALNDGQTLRIGQKLVYYVDRITGETAMPLIAGREYIRNKTVAAGFRPVGRADILVHCTNDVCVPANHCCPVTTHQVETHLQHVEDLKAYQQGMVDVLGPAYMQMEPGLGKTGHHQNGYSKANGL